MIKERLVELVEEPLLSEGYELADLTLASHAGRHTVRMYLYGKNGVPVDECARLSRVVGNIIEATDLFEHGYRLEISSPGLDRPLSSVRDFRYRVGETVRISFAESGRKEIKAKIIGVDDNTVKLDGENGALALDITEIEQALILF